METTIAIIKKNDTSDVRVRIIDLYGRRFVDLRHFSEVGPHTARKYVPTKKGLSVSIELLPALIEGLQEAETRLSGKGDDALPEPGEELWQATLGQRFAEHMAE